MTEFLYKPIYEADRAPLIALMNDAKVMRFLPLLDQAFDEEMACAFLMDKRKIWDECGYGPYAIYQGKCLIGWGGLQPCGNDVEIALVLSPHVWGQGRKVFNDLKREAFDLLGLTSITALLPPIRLNQNAIQRLGFVFEGKEEINAKTFVRYRLYK